MRYAELNERLRLYETEGALEKRDNYLRKIAALHRQRVAKNDAFVLRCEKALDEGDSGLAR